MKAMTLAKTCGVAAGLLAAGATLLTTTGCNTPSFGNEVSTQQEMQVGQQAAAQVESQNQVVTDPAVVEPVQQIAARLFPQASKLRDDVTYKIKVLQSDQVNAFSLPGGWIYIYTGLLSKVGNDKDALACVIGHEAAHVARKHAAKQISDAYGKEALINLLTQGKYQEASNIALQLDLLSHSRDDEYEADKYGLKFAREAGYDDKGMLRFFDTLQKVAPGGPAPEWLQTHPVTTNRVKHAEQDIKDLDAGKY
jgi:predicted Zn-dependent protease